MLYKKLLLVGLLMFFLVFFAKDVKAGSCECKETLDGKVYLVDGGDHCESGETAQCRGGTQDDTHLEPYCECLVEVTSTPAPVTKHAEPFCDGSKKREVNTAIGCVPINFSEFSGRFNTWIFGVAGGVSFLLMVYGFIKMSTSAGDPKAVQGAKETITSAISGLLLSIFGLFILRLIAVDVLHIPGLTKSI